MINLLRKFATVVVAAPLLGTGLIGIGLARAAASNLIANPSVETVNSSNSSLPQGWLQGNWGTNTPVFSYPTTGEDGSRSVEVQMTSYTSGDAKWYFNPVAVSAGSQYDFSDYYESNVTTDLVAQFGNGSGNYTYVDLGSQAPSASWQQANAVFKVPAGENSVTVFHLINSVGELQTDNFSLTAYSAPSGPTVSVTSPSANSTLSGSVQLSATASDAAGIKNVQFQVDGVNVGGTESVSPYHTIWNTSSVSNGSHSIRAIATDNNGKSATSAPVAVNVSNQVAAANLVPNPTLETVNPSNHNLPQSWNHSNWGTNTPSFSYLTTGQTGDRSVKTTISAYTSGSAYWYSNDIPVTGGQMYDFSDYYESNAVTSVDVNITMSDGSSQDLHLGDGYISPNGWTKFDTQFALPSGAVAIGIYHNIAAVGYLTTDDPSLTNFSYQGFSRPIVSLTFDDGYSSTFNNALPMLQADGFDSTQFIITDLVGNNGYVTKANVQTMNSDGEEIASHTVTHDDMTQESAATLQNELSQSQSQLQSWIGAPVTDMAYPYGVFNSVVQSATSNYYIGARSVDEGYNGKNNFNLMALKVQNIFNTTTAAQVASWVQQAQATNTWLILVYHSVDPNTNSPIDGGIYNVTPTQLSEQLAAIKSSGVTVETMAQAISEITPQLP